MSIHRKKAKRLLYLQAQLQRMLATPKRHKSELHPIKHPQNTHLEQHAVILINLPSGAPQPAAAAPARPGCLPARRLPSACLPLPSAAAPQPLGPLCRPCPTPRGGPGGEDSSLRRRSVLAGDASPAPAPVAGRRKAGGGGAAISGAAEAAPMQAVVAEGAPALPPARSLLWWAEPKLLGLLPCHAFGLLWCEPAVFGGHWSISGVYTSFSQQLGVGSAVCGAVVLLVRWEVFAPSKSGACWCGQGQEM